MKKYHAVCQAQDINIPFSFTVEGKEGNEKIGELNPPGLRDLLVGQALLAYQKYRLMLAGELDGAVAIQVSSRVTHAEQA